MPTTLKYKKVITRVGHICFSCHRRFPSRSEMIIWSCIYEGDFNSGYTCMTCEEILKLSEDHGEGFPDGFVNEGLERGETPEIMLERLKKEEYELLQRRLASRPQQHNTV